jgi:hypothetical protein
VTIYADSILSKFLENNVVVIPVVIVLFDETKSINPKDCVPIPIPESVLVLINHNQYCLDHLVQI